MDRYADTKIQKDKDTGKRVFKTTLYPEIVESNNDIYIISREGDRLDLLADSYYGDTTMWWIIAQANAIGKGTLNVTPGLQIRIPQNTEKILLDLAKLNEDR